MLKEIKKWSKNSEDELKIYFFILFILKYQGKLSVTFDFYAPSLTEKD